MTSNGLGITFEGRDGVVLVVDEAGHGPALTLAEASLVLAEIAHAIAAATIVRDQPAGIIDLAAYRTNNHYSE